MSPRFIIYFLLLLVIVLFGVTRFKKLHPPFKLLTAVFVITLISELASRYLAHTIQNSRPAYHFFISLEYLGFAFIYNRLFASAKLRRMAVYSVAFVVLVLRRQHAALPRPVGTSVQCLAGGAHGFGLPFAVALSSDVPPANECKPVETRCVLVQRRRAPCITR